MIKVNIDEKELQDGSHIEIRKRKEGIVVVKIPKGTMLKDVLIRLTVYIQITEYRVLRLMKCNKSSMELIS